LVVAFLFEIVLAVLWLPIAVVVCTRQEIQESWIGTFPNSLHKIKDVYHWIFNG